MERSLTWKTKDSDAQPHRGKNFLFTIGIDTYRHHDNLFNAVRAHVPRPVEQQRRNVGHEAGAEVISEVCVPRDTA
ncbi:MAG: hypothetical protein AAGI38_15205, partial [Bacteroidota bacterium]